MGRSRRAHTRHEEFILPVEQNGGLDIDAPASTQNFDMRSAVRQGDDGMLARSCWSTGNRPDAGPGGDGGGPEIQLAPGGRDDNWIQGAQQQAIYLQADLRRQMEQHVPDPGGQQDGRGPE